MLELARARDLPELGRRLAVTAIALVVYSLGTRVPLPGLHPEALAQLGMANGALHRLSLFALGIGPLVTVLILVELAKIIAPRLRAWEQSDPAHRVRLNRIVVRLGLIAAAAQASGLALALENVGGLVAEPGTPFRLTCIATLVAGTALVIWLADQITRHGIGSGVWLLFMAPLLGALPYWPVRLAAWQNDRTAVALELLAGTAFTALIVAILVRLLLAGRATATTSQTCLWSVLVAKALWPWLVVLIALIAGGGAITETPLGPEHPFSLAVLIALLIAAVYLDVRSQRLAGSQRAQVPAAIIAAILSAVMLAEMLAVTEAAGLVPLAGQLTVVAVVALAILQRWWQPPPRELEPADVEIENAP
jgi:preprotein translocase subunit SecY